MCLKEKEHYEREFRSQQTKFEKMKMDIDVYKVGAAVCEFFSILSARVNVVVLDTHMVYLVKGFRSYGFSKFKIILKLSVRILNIKIFHELS